MRRAESRREGLAAPSSWGVWNLDPVVEEGRKGEERRARTWGEQALIFVHFKHCTVHSSFA